MATVEVLTRARMEAIEAEAIVDARIDVVGAERQLILIKNNEEEVNVGDIRGPIGVTPSLPPIPDELTWNYSSGVQNPARPAADSVPLSIKAGSTVITTNTVGRAAIYFGTNFNGIFSVLAQIGDITNPDYTHLNGAAIAATANTGAFNVQCEAYSPDAFHITLTVPPVDPGLFGTIALPVAVGGCGPIRINWIAIGW